MARNTFFYMQMGPPVLFTQDSSSLKTDSRKFKKFEYSKTGSNSEIGSFSQNFLPKKSKITT